MYVFVSPALRADSSHEYAVAGRAAAFGLCIGVEPHRRWGQRHVDTVLPRTALRFAANTKAKCCCPSCDYAPCGADPSAPAGVVASYQLQQA
jgi:hypothetical protein